MTRRPTWILVKVFVAVLLQFGFVLVFLGVGALDVGEGIHTPYAERGYPEVGNTVGALWLGYLVLNFVLSALIVAYALFEPAQRRLCADAYCMLSCVLLCTVLVLHGSVKKLITERFVTVGAMATRDFERSAELLGWMNERGFRAFVSGPGRVIEIVPLPGHGPEEAKRLLRASSQPVIVYDDPGETQPHDNAEQSPISGA